MAYDDMDEVIAEVLNRMSPQERLELTAELVLASLLKQAPYTLLDGVGKIGFLTYLAHKALAAALQPDFLEELMYERELVGLRIDLADWRFE